MLRGVPAGGTFKDAVEVSAQPQRKNPSTAARARVTTGKKVASSRLGALNGGGKNGRGARGLGENRCLQRRKAEVRRKNRNNHGRGWSKRYLLLRRKKDHSERRPVGLQRCAKLTAGGGGECGDIGGASLQELNYPNTLECS